MSEILNGFYDVTFFFGEFDGQKNFTRTIQFPDHLCTPSVLKAIAYSHRAIFVTCSKYGCRQFNPWYKGIRPTFYSKFCLVPKF